MNGPTKSPTATISRWCVVVMLSIAFGYIESAVVIYLRKIFHPAGFTFPLDSSPLTAGPRNLLLVEIGREAATLVIILAGCMLAGRNRRQRLAYFLTIFAVWDISYYVWLKVILDWPASVLDFDVLFLIPLPWVGPVLAPIIVSITMLVFAAVILYRDHLDRPIRPSLWDWSAFFAAAIVIIVSFCIAGQYMAQPDYAGHFNWPLFIIGLLAAGGVFTKCLLKSKPRAGA